MDKLGLTDAVVLDKRSFKLLYIERIKQFHPLYVTFINSSLNSIKFIVVSNFILSLSVNLAFNAFFYSDQYISKMYKSGYNLLANIPKSIYSAIIGVLISFLCHLLKYDFPSDEALRSVNTLNRDIQYKQLIVRKMKRMIIIYFCVIFSLSLLFWYFVSAFCGVYQNSQISWFTGFIITLVINFSIPFIIAFISVLFRKIALCLGAIHLFYVARVMESYS